MRQYTTPEQTAKLIELGFEKPKSIEVYRDGHCVPFVEQRWDYSIGELIEMLHCLPMVIDISAESVVSSGLGRGYGVYTQSKELIDALFEQIVKLKEMGVI